MAQHLSLTGTWSGSYRYPGDAYTETVFEATIEERDGKFTGHTAELGNGFHANCAIVTADIDGERFGQTVRFTKFMDGSGGMHHVIIYEGQSDAQLTRVEGTWTIPGEWSGRFFMVRESNCAEAAAVEEAQAVKVAQRS